MKNSKIFLVTTGTKKFWDLKNPNLVLAGEWCRHSTDTQSSKIRVLPYLWDDVHEVHKAQIYCDNIYENILVQITQVLNEYFNIDKEIKYYRILLGNWLIHFIHQAYDKYKIFQSAKRLGDVKTHLIKRKNYYYAQDTLEYVTLNKSHLYQLQLFSCIAKSLKINGENIDIYLPEIFSKKSKRIDFKILLKSKLKFIKYKIYKLLSNPQLVIVNPYFKKNSHRIEFQLWMKSKRRILFDPFDYQNINTPVIIDKNFRHSFTSKSEKFEDFIFSLVIQNIPISYLENHKKNIESIKGLYESKNLKFFTYNDLYFNTKYQFFLANNYHNHKILSAQHGGSYGMDLMHVGENFEKSISNIFYTYGWTDAENTKPLPMPNLIETKNNKKSKTILMVMTIRDRYVIRFVNATKSSKAITDHVMYPITFLKNLKNFDKVRMRHLRDLYKSKWNIKRRIEKEFPHLKLDKISSYYKSLSECRLAVFDHFGTPFLESLQANTPSIVFINKTSYLFRSDFKPYLEQMIQSKMLFYEPKMAAEHINQIYNDVQKWWSSESIKSLVRSFVKCHAYTSKDWMNIWCDEFINGN